MQEVRCMDWKWREIVLRASRCLFINIYSKSRTTPLYACEYVMWWWEHDKINHERCGLAGSRSATQTTDKSVPCVVAHAWCMPHPVTRSPQTEMNWLCRLFGRPFLYVWKHRHGILHARARAYVIPGCQMTLVTWRLLNRSSIYACIDRSAGYTYIMYWEKISETVLVE